MTKIVAPAKKMVKPVVERFSQLESLYGYLLEEADMGAEAIKKIRRKLDLQSVSEELREELIATRSWWRGTAQKGVLRSPPGAAASRVCGSGHDWSRGDQREVRGRATASPGHGAVRR